MNAIMRIQDQKLQQAEHEKLVAEMMRDPVFKKIARLLMKTGANSAKSLLEILSLLKNFDLF